MGAKYSSYLEPKSYNSSEIIQTGTVFYDKDENIFLEKIKKLLNNLKTKQYPFRKINNIEQINITSEEYYNIVHNFISLYNKTYTLQIKYLKESFYQKEIINDKYYRYIITFFVEFEFRNWFKVYHIAFVLLLDQEQFININVKQNLVDVDLLGAWSNSDIKFGSYSKKGLNIYLDKLKEADFQKYSYVIPTTSEISNTLRNKEYIFDSIYQINLPKYQFEKEKLLYVKPPEINPVKIKLGEKCLMYKNKKFSMKDCKNTNSKWKFLNTLKIQHYNTNNCIAYHGRNEFGLVDCNSHSYCKTDNKLQSCQKFKTIKYGGLEIDDAKSCIDIDKNGKLINQKCNKSQQIRFLK